MHYLPLLLASTLALFLCGFRYLSLSSRAAAQNERVVFNGWDGLLLQGKTASPRVVRWMGIACIGFMPLLAGAVFGYPKLKSAVQLATSPCQTLIPPEELARETGGKFSVRHGFATDLSCSLELTNPHGRRVLIDVAGFRTWSVEKKRAELLRSGAQFVSLDVPNGAGFLAFPALSEESRRELTDLSQLPMDSRTIFLETCGVEVSIHFDSGTADDAQAKKLASSALERLGSACKYSLRRGRRR